MLSTEHSNLEARRPSKEQMTTNPSILEKQNTNLSIATSIYDRDGEKQTTMGRQVKMSENEIESEMKDVDDNLDFSRMDINN